MVKSCKKILVNLLIMAMFVVSLPCNVTLVQAATIVASGTCGDTGNEENVTWEYDSDDVLTIKGSGAIKGYSYSLTDRPGWYKYADTVKKIVISEGITVIGYKAFYQMSEEEVSLPSTLEDIQYEAFKENYNLKEINLPVSLKSISMGALDYTAITDLKIPGTAESIPAGFTCLNFDNVELEEGIDHIAYSAFTGIIKRLWLPASITVIRDDSFREATTWQTVCYGHSDYVKTYADALGYIYVDATKNYSLADVEIVLDTDTLIYDGTEKEAVVKASFEMNGVTVPLYEGYDFTVSYKDNVEIGTATVTVSGKGCYEGQIEKTYRIVGDIAESQVALEYDSVLYDGEEKQPKATVTYKNTVLKENTDYIVSYENNVEEGTAIVKIAGQGNYTGTITKTFSIAKIDISDAIVTPEYDSIVYDGEAKEPKVEVKLGEKILKKDIDYTVSYENNTMPGEANVIIAGNGVYKGSITQAFEIEGIAIDKAEVKLDNSIFSYDGSEKKPAVTVTLNGKTLVKGTDFTVSYRNNILEGTAYVIVEGCGIYAGKVEVSFAILPYNAGMDSVYEEGETILTEEAVYMVTDDEEKEVEYSSIANKNVKDLVIPATITTEDGTVYKVTSIGNKAFYKNTKIQTIVIGNNVTSIEDYAFYGCKNLTSIKMGKKVEMIGNSSFRKCTKLKSITLPKSIDSLGKNAFYGCKKLNTITINANSVVDINKNAIKGISKKCVIKVPKKLMKKYKKELKKSTGFKSSMKIKKK